jgi:hypothetical protein
LLLENHRSGTVGFGAYGACIDAGEALFAGWQDSQRKEQ